MKFAIFAEDTSERFFLVRFPKLVTRKEPQVVRHSVVRFVIRNPSLEKTETFLDPMITVLIVIKLHRDVVRQVVSLKFPDLDEVRLDFRQCFKRCGKLVIVFGFLVLDRLQPQHVDRHTSQTK